MKKATIMILSIILFASVLFIYRQNKEINLLKVQEKQFEKQISLLKRTELPVTIFTITRNNMQVVSSLGSEQDTFIKHHHYSLKTGNNEGYLVLQEGQSFEWIITNY